MLREVKQTIEEHRMIESGDRILIGLSGGADSVCLTEILWELSGEYKIGLCAVHCHHEIRGKEADEDAEFAEAFCREREIPFYMVRENVIERAGREKISTEEAGRNFRYETFEKIMEQEGCNKLAVAHNANDRAETMLFHLSRGTGLAGLAAMEPERVFSGEKRLIRPLIRTERDTIEEWLLQKKISWKLDRTNLGDDYTRNRIRHFVLPELKRINNRAVLHMGDTAEAVREGLGYLKTEEERAYRCCVEEVKEKKGTILSALSLPEFMKLHPYMKKAVLYRFLSEALGRKKDLERVHVSMLLDLASGNSGRQINLSEGLKARREYERLILFREEETEEKEEIPIEKEGVICWDAADLVLEVKKTEPGREEIFKKKYTKFFDCDKIDNGLRLRYWQPGDYIYLREDGGRKKLNRFFIDEKIPPDDRKKIPLLADGDHIMWIVGYRISAYYKVTDQTEQILRVSAKNKG